MDALPRGGGEEVGGGGEAVQWEIIHCQLMVQQLGPGEEESYARNAVEVCYYWHNEGVIEDGACKKVASYPAHREPGYEASKKDTVSYSYLLFQ